MCKRLLPLCMAAKPLPPLHRQPHPSRGRDFSFSTNLLITPLLKNTNKGRGQPYFGVQMCECWSGQPCNLLFHCETKMIVFLRDYFFATILYQFRSRFVAVLIGV